MKTPEHLSELGILPPDWDWRPGQRELVERIAASPKKIVMLEAECGTGKSAIAVAAAAVLDQQALVLIQTIQLQEQYLRDFKGGALIKGRRHFDCNLTDKPADRAPCTVGVRCSKKGVWDYGSGMPIGTPECWYFQAKAAARTAQISIQNYHYWLNETKSSRTFAKIPMIICDEGHELDQILMASATIELTADAIEALGLPWPSDTATLEGWKLWAGKVSPEVRQTVRSEEARLISLGYDIGDEETRYEQSLEGSIPTTADLSSFEKDTELYRAAKAMETILSSILVDVSDEDWVLDAKRMRGGSDVWYFKPIFGKYGFRRILNAATEKVVIMSAFLAPQMLIRTLGLDPEDVDVIEAPQTFDRRRSPVVYLPTFKVSYETTQSEPKMRWLVGMIDAVIDEQAPKKGIIHVPSVQLRNTILRHSRYRDDMVTYEGAASSADARSDALTKDEALERFARPGFSVLLGQSVSTGVDLPYVPQWQIIPKLPFAPVQDVAIKARKERDKDFYPYHTICQVVQATGRVKRAADHDGPTFILDEQFGWFFQRHKEDFPDWFRRCLDYWGWQRHPDLAAKKDHIARSAGVFLPQTAKMSTKSKAPIMRLGR